MKVMTFNMRVANHGDGDNSFWERKPRILKMLSEEAPDIIGFQEATDEMRAWVRENLCGYTIIGCGRERNYHGESVAAAVKNSRFEIVSAEHFWLSNTPDVPGSRFDGDQSNCPRLTLRVKLADGEDGRLFNVYVTHLDHEGAQARYLGMTENIQHISKHCEKFIYMGDMNASPDSPEIKLFSKAMAYRGGVDVTDKVGDTFHGFGKCRADKIDYIFTDGVCHECHKVKDDGEINGRYYSDHYAICAEIDL